MKADVERYIIWLLILLIVIIMMLAIYFNLGKNLITELTWEKIFVK